MKRGMIIKNQGLSFEILDIYYKRNGNIAILKCIEEHFYYTVLDLTQTKGNNCVWVLSRYKDDRMEAFDDYENRVKFY